MPRFILEYEVVPEEYRHGTFQFSGQRTETIIEMEKLDPDILNGKKIPKNLEEKFPGGGISLVSYREIKN